MYFCCIQYSSSMLGSAFICTRILNFNRYSAHHQDYLVSLGGYILIEPSLEVREAPLNRIGTYAAASNLVGHEDKGGIYRGKAVKFIFQSLECIFNRRLFPFIGRTVEEEIGAPKRDTVDDHHLIIYIVTMA